MGACLIFSHSAQSHQHPACSTAGNSRIAPQSRQPHPPTVRLELLLSVNSSGPLDLAMSLCSLSVRVARWGSCSQTNCQSTTAVELIFCFALTVVDINCFEFRFWHFNQDLIKRVTMVGHSINALLGCSWVQRREGCKGSLASTLTAWDWNPLVIRQGCCRRPWGATLAEQPSHPASIAQSSR